MRLFFNVTIALVLLGHTSRGDTPAIASLRKSAMAYEDATTKRDAKKLTEFMYPKLKEALGGAEKITKMFQMGFDGMDRNGGTLEEFWVDDPIDIIQRNKIAYSIVETRMTVKKGDKSAMTPSYLIAVSTDDGSTWIFLEGPFLKPKTAQKSRKPSS